MFVTLHAAAHKPVGGACVSRQERDYRNVRCRADLARQPHAGRSGDPRQRISFEAGRGRQSFQTFNNPNAAGGAAPAPATNRCVGNTAGAERFQYGGAGQQRHDLAGRVGQLRRTPEPVQHAANGAPGERQRDEREIATE